MTAHLTPEQVAKLRLPAGYELVDELEESDFSNGRYGVEWSDGSGSPRNYAMASVAVAVANGHLPPEALEVVWAVVEGKVRPIRYMAVCAAYVELPEYASDKATHLAIEVKP